MESATAGSTSRIFLYSSATGSMASAVPDEVGPTAMSTLSSPKAAASCDLPTSGLVCESRCVTTILRLPIVMVPPVAYSSPIISPMWVCLA
jgi:hypothetical protein